MKVQKSELLKLFTALGLPDTETLSEEKFEAKVKRMSKYTPEEGAAAINPVALGALFEKVVSANAAGDGVEIEDDTAKKKTAKAPAKPEPAAKGKKKAVKTEAEPTPKKKAKKPGRKATEEGGWTPDKGPLPFAEGGSVIKSIVEILTKAGERGKPLTKDEIHEKMKKLYPDRDAKKMYTTMSNQVPSRLRIVRGIHVWKSSKTVEGQPVTAYWIENGGRKPQPETKQEKKEVNKKKADDGKSEAEVAAAASKKKSKKPAAE